MIRAAAQQIEPAVDRPVHPDAPQLREQVRALIVEVRIIPSPADPKAVPRPSLAGVMRATGLVERRALKTTKAPDALASGASVFWLRGQDLNLRPSGYEPDELPGCSTPRRGRVPVGDAADGLIVMGECRDDLCGPGGDRLSRVLRHSTMGAETFDGRVRDGIGSCRLAKATRPAKIVVGSDGGCIGFRVGARPPGVGGLVGHGLMRAIKPNERLVPVSYTHCCASTPGLSTWWSSTALQGELVSRWVSSLDAFSSYPVRT